MDKRWAVAAVLFVVVVAIALLLFSPRGIAGSTSSGGRATRTNIVLPHSGEDVTLPIVDSFGDRYSSWYKAELIDPNRTISYEQSWSKYGDGYTLHYTDAIREYEVEMKRPGSSPPRRITFRCLKGDCDNFLNQVRFGDEFSKVKCPGTFFVNLCFSNGTYRQFYTNANSAYQESQEYLFQSKNMDEKEFVRAQEEYDEKNNASASIKLNQDDMVELSGWRSVCKYPFKVDTGGEPFDPFNHEDVTNESNFLIVGKINPEIIEKTGNGCPNETATNINQDEALDSQSRVREGYVNRNEISGEGLKVTSYYAPEAEVSVNGSFTTRTGKIDSQILYVLDKDGKQRGFAVSLPEDEKPLVFDAASTTKAVLWVGGGLEQKDAENRLKAIENLSCYHGFYTYLKSRLSQMSFSDIHNSENKEYYDMAHNCNLELINNSG